jgi:protoheme IX farnesyltransferase
MTDATWTNLQAPSRDAEFGDYVELLKPRVMWLVIFTAMVGLVCAPVSVHPVIGLAAILCVAVGAGASGALNMWWDADIDAVMTRTAGRPIPSGRLRRGEALAVGLALSGFSVAMLGLFANLFAAALLAFTIFFYVVVYSVWLKRATPQNIVIGGAAGAFPPVIGWAVATGGLAPESLLMFALIFLWTPPHFWALALFRNEDYARAGVPMLPVTAGPRHTRGQILLYSLVLAPAAVAPAFSAVGGPAFLAGALVLNAALLRGAWAIWRRDEASAAADGHRRREAVLRLLHRLPVPYVRLVPGRGGAGALGLGLGGWPTIF